MAGDQVSPRLGEFIVHFSHIEAMLRAILGMALRLPPTEPVTASYDFRTLCDVTLAAYLFRSTDPAAPKKFKKLIDRCKTLNNTYRGPVVHGTWTNVVSFDDEKEPRFSALHMSRQTLQVKEHFADPQAIDMVLRECASIKSELAGIMAKPWLQPSK